VSVPLPVKLPVMVQRPSASMRAAAPAGTMIFQAAVSEPRTSAIGDVVAGSAQGMTGRAWVRRTDFVYDYGVGVFNQLAS
jgi:hypothetical protein